MASICRKMLVFSLGSIRKKLRHPDSEVDRDGGVEARSYGIDRLHSIYLGRSATRLS